MKLAFLTDLHANREAMEAVLEHIESQGPTQLVFLGDLVGYGADPSWVVERVRVAVSGGALAVRGNHDEAAVQGPSSHMAEMARQALLWTRGQLGEAQLDFLAALPLSQSLGDCLFVHANAFAPAQWAYITGRADALRSLRATRATYTVCGHMHEPRLYHRSVQDRCGEFVPTPGVGIPVPALRQWLVVPGSVGQPRDGDPAACYACLDLDQRVLFFHRVPYDHDLAAAKIRAAGLPVALATRLADGQ